MKTIQLTQGKEALVCDCHYELVAAYKWSLHSKGYAYRQVAIGGKKVAIMMHRVINGTIRGLQPDHLDRNKLNNQCFNLEAVTVQENVRRALERPDCKSGHLMTQDNTYIRTDGKRRCRACMRKFNRKYKARKRSEGNLHNQEPQS